MNEYSSKHESLVAENVISVWMKANMAEYCFERSSERRSQNDTECEVAKSSIPLTCSDQSLSLTRFNVPLDTV